MSNLGNYSEAIESQIWLIQHVDGIVDPKIDWKSQHFAKSSLEEGHTVYVSSDISHMLAATAASIPDTPILESDLPLLNGFVWFADPLPLPRDPHYHGEDDVVLCGFSWLKALYQEFDGFVACAWVGNTDRKQIWLGNQVHWDWSSSWNSFSSPVANADDQAAHEYLTASRRYICALFTFMSQTIVESSDELVERHVRKRVERAGWDHTPLVRVVRLRRVQHVGRSDSNMCESPEWSCQWIVRGHWRQQAYGEKLAQRKPLWITPYVKGPDDKPLKPPRATLFAVVR